MPKCRALGLHRGCGDLPRPPQRIGSATAAAASSSFSYPTIPTGSARCAARNGSGRGGRGEGGTEDGDKAGGVGGGMYGGVRLPMPFANVRFRIHNIHAKAHSSSMFVRSDMKTEGRIRREKESVQSVPSRHEKKEANAAPPTWAPMLYAKHFNQMTLGFYVLLLTELFKRMTLGVAS